MSGASAPMREASGEVTTGTSAVSLCAGAWCVAAVGHQARHQEITPERHPP